MEERDVPVVSGLLCLCYRWLAEREGYTPEQVDFLLSERGSEKTVRRESTDQLYLVASVDGLIRGMVSVANNEITKLYVEPSCHRQGIGTALLASAESAIREAGFRDMSLGTTPSTVPFYEKSGMSLARWRRPSTGPFRDRQVAVMEKALS